MRSSILALIQIYASREGVYSRRRAFVPQKTSSLESFTMSEINEAFEHLKAGQVQIPAQKRQEFQLGSPEPGT
jgi:hypothetical protein